MIHHSKNCATLSIVQDKGCYSDLFTSNKELVLKLKRLDFCPIRVGLHTKDVYFYWVSSYRGLLFTKMGDEAGIICNETESCEKVLWSVVIDLCVSRKCEMKRNSTILLARQSPCLEKNNRNLEKTSVKLCIAGLAPWTTDLGPSPGNWQTL